MTKDELIEWLKGKGYQKDTYGHYQKKDDKGNVHRYKIQDISVRYETQINISDPYSNRPKHEWVRLLSGYYKNLSLNEKNQLVGLKR
jgi:hypothetical protein